MLKVGLTGGIGAGKSAVARRLVHHGAVLIDADRLAREVVAAGTPGQAAVVEAFGPEVLGADGELNRPALGARVFGDPAARRRLEAIIHPLVRARTARLTADAGPGAIVVNDVPLLVETGIVPTYHCVVVVRTDPERRIARLAATRGMDRAEAQARIAAQASDAERRAAADVVLDNDAGLDALHARVDRLWHERLVPFEELLRSGRAARSGPRLHIVEPDPTWPEQAARLIARIEHALRSAASPPAASPPAAVSPPPDRLPPAGGDGLVVHHIGSTAVPGLPGKDIVDLMLGVRSLDEADALAAALGRAGFPRRPGEWSDTARNTPGETWPKRMHSTADPGRPVHLHVRVIGSPGWRFALLMRDHLRADTAARDRYAAAKYVWATEHELRADYQDAKEPWFDEEARAAEDWATATGWHPGT